MYNVCFLFFFLWFLFYKISSSILFIRNSLNVSNNIKWVKMNYERIWQLTDNKAGETFLHIEKKNPEIKVVII